jgi:hypothetical protein
MGGEILILPLGQLNDLFYPHTQRPIGLCICQFLRMTGFIAKVGMDERVSQIFTPPVGDIDTPYFS